MLNSNAQVARRSVQGLRGAGFYRRSIARPAGRPLFGALAFGALLAGASLAPSCTTVPVTGRSALNLMSIDDDKRLGAQAYAEVLKTAKLKDNGPEYAQVKRVTDRLIPVVDDPGFQWEVHVIDDPKTVNAWCMPGGKIAVYTGILPLTKDDASLAVVLAHEIGHAVARHGTERMSQSELRDSTLQAFSAVNQSVAQYQAAIGEVTNLFVLQSWGRDQESEADHIGLIYMARAGYDPHVAIDFWQRMQAQSQGAPPEWLSTHPTDEHRINDIRRLMPDAERAYKRAGGTP
jgi:predicted Zn-dependent protease